MTHDEIARLSAAERLSLIGQLWDSIADSDAPLPPLQREELLRRLASFENDKRATANWDAIKAELPRKR